MRRTIREWASAGQWLARSIRANLLRVERRGAPCNARTRRTIRLQGQSNPAFPCKQTDGPCHVCWIDVIVMRLHLLPVSARRAITSQGAGCRKLSGLRPRLSRDVRHVQPMQHAHRIGVQRRDSQGLVRQIWQGPANSGVHPPLKPGPAPPGPARADPLTAASSCQLGHSRAISSLAFSPASGTALASAGGGPRPIRTHPPRHDPPEQPGALRADGRHSASHESSLFATRQAATGRCASGTWRQAR
jgi:hypothetical protein